MLCRQDIGEDEKHVHGVQQVRFSVPEIPLDYPLPANHPGFRKSTYSLLSAQGAHS